MTIRLTEDEVALILMRFNRMDWEWGNERLLLLANSVKAKLTRASRLKLVK